ncbi:phosphotransferase family protein [Curtobacterium luteum]|uniref:phosphotransferase family protein n=1 Tax=Curtobacterium luteum TaxID=33881 RepID=UPI00187C0A4B|nr:phosphotransferase [Curtobacterium luteum]
MSRDPVNLREVDLAPVATALEATWPALRWRDRRFVHGAFHGVVLLEDVAVRVAFGTGHRHRTTVEAENSRRFQDLPHGLAVPTPVLEPASTRDWTAAVYTRVDGAALTASTWAEARRVYLPVLERLRSLPTHLPGAKALRPVRDWCGGDAWPAIVDETTEALPTSALRDLARGVVAELLHAEADAVPAVVHGDLSPFNVLVATDSVGLIDVDHASVADPAIDLSWLVRSFPADELRRDLRPDELARARLHRTAGPLQLAAAAHRNGDSALLHHALRTFASRAVAAARA